MALLAAALLAGCVSISRPPEGTTVVNPTRVQAVVSTPTKNSDGSTSVKPGDRQVKADVRIDGVLKDTIQAQGGAANAINVDRSYSLTPGNHTLVITGYEVDGDTSTDTRHFTVGSPGAIKQVVWIWFENHGASQARNVGEFKTLADSYGDATNFFAHTHPSQPNYRGAVVARVARRGMAAANRRDFDVLLYGLDPEIEYRPRTDLAGPDMDAVFHGHRGYVRVWEQLLEAFEDARLDIEKLNDLGSCLLTQVRFTGHGSGSGVPVDELLFQLFKLRYGLVIWQQDFGSRDEALAAAGLGLAKA